MSMNRRFILLIFLLFIVGYVLPIKGQQSTGPDAWENYQNWRQPPEQVMKAIGVRTGMVIGEIGAGRGRYAVRLALKVGRTGKIYANDILESKLEYLRFRCKRDNISNLVTVLGEVTKPNFPEGVLDMVFMINTYHHVEKPVELLKNSKYALKPDGRLVIVEHDPEKSQNMGSHSTHKKTLIKQMEEAGFKLMRIETFLPQDNIYIFRLKGRKEVKELKDEKLVNVQEPTIELTVRTSNLFER